MNLDDGAVAGFAPVDPDLYTVTFTQKDGETWSEPVVGFATVWFRGAVDSDPADTALNPVILADGYPTTVYRYMNNWEQDKPRWNMARA